jgi:hypothetical protein
MGRFPIAEAGSTFVDGIQLENHWSESLYSTYFGGLNPQKRQQSYLEYDSKAQVKGASLTYQKISGNWNENLYLSHGFVQETYQANTDRQFLFHQSMYQWDSASRIMSLVYYDMVPRSYVQNGNFTWQQGWPRGANSEFGYSAVDAISYSRTKDILEKLPSSPYTEVRLKLSTKIGDLNDKAYLLFSQGHRGNDGLNKNLAEVGYIRPEIWGPRWDGYFAIGQRHNFVSEDMLLKFGISRYSPKWEMSIDNEIRQQKPDQSSAVTAVLTEGALTYFLTRLSFVTFSGQYAADSNVKIYSGFFKYGYRFGNRELPPLRDGAPPRGPL